LIDQDFRLRAQSVEAVDRLIGNIEATLKARGLAGNTYIVFSSDNGYHMGQHRLLPGKQTAFDSDIRVPLIVAGPRVPRNRRISAFAENVDLYPTFLGLAGAKPTETVDGRSLLPLLHATPRTRLTWRAAVVIEHRGKTGTGDPDIDYGNLSGNPTSYEAVRLPGAVYVEYLDGEREYYDIVARPLRAAQRLRPSQCRHQSAVGRDPPAAYALPRQRPDQLLAGRTAPAAEPIGQGRQANRFSSQ
jgi:N-acetylglucosamine-6-sulfatase